MACRYNSAAVTYVSIASFVCPFSSRSIAPESFEFAWPAFIFNSLVCVNLGDPTVDEGGLTLSLKNSWCPMGDRGSDIIEVAVLLSSK